jgi:hypothetical protein
MQEMEIPRGLALGTAPYRSVDDVVTAVGEARANLIDGWEATALVESLGYDDARVSRDFGFADTHVFGMFIYEKLAHRPHALRDGSDDEPERTRRRDVADSVGAGLVCAVPWLLFLLANRVSLAFVASLAVTGGFVQAMNRRGQFYFGARQPGLAALVCGFLFRAGTLTAILAAAAGLFCGWYFKLAGWPTLVLATDQFVAFCAIWLLCGLLTVRSEQWRVPAAYLAGGAAFMLARIASGSIAAAQLAAGATVLVAAAAQLPIVFAQPDGSKRLLPVPLPRRTVLLYGLLPYLIYGAMYFCFLFADTLLRRRRGDGMDLALTIFLFAVASVEYANLRFSHHLRRAARTASASASETFRRSAGRRHLQALGIVVGGFTITAALIGVGARLVWPDVWTAPWTRLAFSEFGYLLFALGLLNALVLFTLNRPWAAVRSLAAGFVFQIGAGVVAGGGVFLILSTIDVRRTLRRADHAVAVS